MAMNDDAVLGAYPPSFGETPYVGLNVLESHTTPSRGGIKYCFEPGSVEARKHPLDQLQIYATDQIRVLLGKRMERAVDQRQFTRIDARLVAKVHQGLGRRVAYGRAALRSSILEDGPSE